MARTSKTRRARRLKTREAGEARHHAALCALGHSRSTMDTTLLHSKACTKGAYVPFPHVRPERKDPHRCKPWGIK